MLLFYGYLNNLFVSFPNVQFSKAELGRTFAGKAYDSFNGERNIVSRDTYNSLWLSCSTFSDFKSMVLPQEKGIVQGILRRNYFNSRYILKINNPTDITFIDSRCDPFFEENFEANRLGLFYKNGWYNYAHEGTQFWEVYEDENSLGQSVHIGSYRSGDVSTISWLISPKLDLSSLKNPQVAFRTSVSFPDESILEALVSSDWNGQIEGLETATWNSLSAVIASKHDESRIFIDSGNLSLNFMEENCFLHLNIQEVEKLLKMAPMNWMIFIFLTNKF